MLVWSKMHAIYVSGYICGYIWHMHQVAAMLVASILSRFLAVLDARCFLANGQENARAKQEDGRSPSNAIRP